MDKVLDLFLTVKRESKRAGRLLAACLATAVPFKFHSVSLVGFSLGCQVVKSCCRALDKLTGESSITESGGHRSRVLTTITFMGGAVSFKKTEVWAQIFRRVATGEVRNIYSEGDSILSIFENLVKKVSIGRQELRLPMSNWVES
mmetsp:Transcript_39948/g.61116  ORF Transcript_39948/g.61116 Transcript_39948/m.61116 type:complete len:145 (-) Transcript_39948:196-630(-)